MDMHLEKRPSSRVSVAEESVITRLKGGEFQRFLADAMPHAPSALRSWALMGVGLERLANVVRESGESLSGFDAFDVDYEGGVTISGSATHEDFQELSRSDILSGSAVLGVGGMEASLFAQMGADVVIVDPGLESSYSSGNGRVIGLALNEQVKALIEGRYGKRDVAITNRVLHEGSGVLVPDVGVNYGEEIPNGVRLAELVHELVRPGGWSLHNGSIAEQVLSRSSVEGEVVVYPYGEEGEEHESVWVVKK